LVTKSLFVHLQVVANCRRLLVKEIKDYGVTEELQEMVIPVLVGMQTKGGAWSAEGKKGMCKGMVSVLVLTCARG
jgi:hypothetical protein